MKKKYIFISLLTVLIVFLSSIAIGLYDNVEGKITDKSYVINSYLVEDMKYFTLAKTMELDPDFKIFSFGKDVPENVQNSIYERFEDNMTSSVSLLENDSNFIYYVKNKENGNYVKSDIDASKENDNIYYVSFSYDSKGNLKSDTNYSASYFSKYPAYNYISSMYGDSAFVVEDGVEYYYIDGYTIPYDQIKMNIPKNMSFTYAIPKVLSDNGGAISYYINSWENYNPFTGVCLLIGSAIIAIFILFAPTNIVKEVKPFKTFISFKGEVNLFLISFIITMCCMACFVCAGYSINGMFLSLMNKIGLRYPNFMVLVSNILVWVVTFLSIAIGCFDIKYIFVEGIWRFIKEDTLISLLVRKVKEVLNNLISIDLKYPVNKKLMKFLFMNMLIIIFLTFLWGFGSILAIIYSVFLFFMLKKKTDEIHNNYNTLLSSTHELAKGNFNDEMNEDMGVFNSLRDEFKNIEEGFKEAVKEETKSQNMKTELISNVSHDLKTPLTGIKNYVELMGQEGIPNEQKEEYLKMLNQYIDRLSNLIEDLFEVSKVNSGDIKLDLMELNIVSLIEQTKSECSDLFESRNLDVIMNTYDMNINLLLDGNKTYRVFENLFNNISKYAMEGTRVYIDITEEDDKVIISLKNISAAQMNFTSDEIVERFVRGDKSRHESGSGLGLAIVKSFVEAQGGSFSIDIDGDLFKAVVIFNK
ncbi:sensor histidine kinase KdpD [Anaerofustis sp. NSJ-163]|uniref:sensor histidine kinase n=1 Tax=Anaerofustis sp. NSJ-163 TaxID=2944391 RepID=UPI00209BE78B|nr:HAMP domain-containing sensor histidine kinase [Anaerofustis sp. NSJ-163]MCO8193139.1 HAMP domain-containing histidine kinase [Anaerofustis sp. NSJ-163]